MHTYCLGVAFDLIREWISSDNEDQPFYLNEIDIERINNRIKNIKMPHSESSRLPRNLNEYKDWKGYEFQSFILHFGIIVLKGISFMS
jgi:hypothetical protein